MRPAFDNTICAAPCQCHVFTLSLFYLHRGSSSPAPQCSWFVDPQTVLTIGLVSKATNAVQGSILGLATIPVGRLEEDAQLCLDIDLCPPTSNVTHDGSADSTHWHPPLSPSLPKVATVHILLIVSRAAVTTTSEAVTTRAVIAVSPGALHDSAATGSGVRVASSCTARGEPPRRAVVRVTPSSSCWDCDCIDDSPVYMSGEPSCGPELYYGGGGGYYGPGSIYGGSYGGGYGYPYGYGDYGYPYSYGYPYGYGYGLGYGGWGHRGWGGGFHSHGGGGFHGGGGGGGGFHGGGGGHH
jgi:hypothetical protein